MYKYDLTIAPELTQNWMQALVETPEEDESWSFMKLSPALANAATTLAWSTQKEESTEFSQTATEVDNSDADVVTVGESIDVTLMSVCLTPMTLLMLTRSDSKMAAPFSSKTSGESGPKWAPMPTRVGGLEEMLTLRRS